MKRINLFLLSLALASTTMFAQNPKISIFCDHIEDIVKQEGISFRDAASRLREAGYTGVDVRVKQNPAELATLKSLGFEYACAITDLDWSKGDQTAAEKETLAFMKKTGCRKLLVVTGLMNDFKGDYEAVKLGLASFVHRASAQGVEVMIEDYDNARSACYNIGRISGLLDYSPELGHVFDSGNYLFAGEDCIKAMHLFNDRIGHIHLKDRRSPKDLSCPAVGAGCIPITEVIKLAQFFGYDGWFTVEHYGSRTMLADALASYENVRKAIELEKMTPEMTEYYAPAIPVVKPSEVVTLFDGSNLDAWTGRGGKAGWTVNGDGTMTVDKKAGDIVTKAEFGSYRLHLEWCVPVEIQGSSQARGNSGVFMHNLYEVQILDSYENPTYVNGAAGSIYKQSAPLCNPIRKPGEWNVYDIIFTAPKFNDKDELVARPRITVYFNGVLVQDDFEIKGTTEYIGMPRQVYRKTGPISLQSHGDPSAPISFRNIWIQETE